MKLQCDEKREMFEYMVGQFREKGKSRHGKGETFTSQQLQVVCDEYDDVARLCIFRVESLKQGQSRSLLTQAARHHAAQLDQLSVPSAQTPKVKDIEVHMGSSKSQGDEILSQRSRAGSHSAPIYPEKFDPSDRIREMRTAVQKLNTHVLPTPADAKGSVPSSSAPQSSSILPVESSKNPWHSSPLNIEKPKKSIDDHLSARSFSKAQTAVEETGNNKHFLPLPRPLTEGAAVPQFDTQGGFDTRKIKRQAFSGPLASKPSSNKPLLPTSGPISSSGAPQSVSGLLPRASGPQAPSFVNVSHNASPPLVSSPKISELHELPRPPDSFSSKPMRSVVALGHSAPLVNRNREVSPTNRNPSRQSKEGSPLPLPQLTVSRSFSIPSSSQRASALQSGKLLDSSEIVQKAEEVASPPLTPISLSNMKPPNSGQIRGEVNTVIMVVSSSA
ncbi:UNVERIFIED_CONTAM: hypothetical protein Sradi_3031200 [Sesamum radiatum]|uniref:Hydroxyproline-rich glycoprotein family protein n=1 Tax=Sesamum radiatum TaxID=300843 RepID=A0AAW2RAM5_SESRA